MGAGDGGYPHPSDPTIPCGGRPDDHPSKGLPQPKLPVVGQQVDTPATYAIAGRVLLAASGAFAGILLALVALHVCRGTRRDLSRGGGGRRRLLRSLAIAGGVDGEDRGGGAAPSQRGLDPAVLRALPVAPAGAGAGDCAVCLAELERGEDARALPRCGHRFHVECIDAWFRGNSTCPLCRAAVEPPDEALPETRIDVDPAAAPAPRKCGAPAAMGRLASGTDLEKTRRVFASTRSASF